MTKNDALALKHVVIFVAYEFWSLYVHLLVVVITCEECTISKDD